MHYQIEVRHHDRRHHLRHFGGIYHHRLHSVRAAHSGHPVAVEMSEGKALQSFELLRRRKGLLRKGKVQHCKALAK